MQALFILTKFYVKNSTKKVVLKTHTKKNALKNEINIICLQNLNDNVTELVIKRKHKTHTHTITPNS